MYIYIQNIHGYIKVPVHNSRNNVTSKIHVLQIESKYSTNGSGLENPTTSSINEDGMNICIHGYTHMY